jgi:hypothetical protein
MCGFGIRNRTETVGGARNSHDPAGSRIFGLKHERSKSQSNKAEQTECEEINAEHLLRPFVSETFITCFANFYLLHPFGLKDLASREATHWIWIENGVNDVSALSLQWNISNIIWIDSFNNNSPDARPQWV